MTAFDCGVNVTDLVVAHDSREGRIPYVEMSVMDDVDRTDLRSGLRGRPAEARDGGNSCEELPAIHLPLLYSGEMNR
jgi:hypothetical protein